MENNLAEGRDVLFDVDWQGTQQLKNNANDDLVCIFILPPSLLELEKRLKKRARDPKNIVKERMESAISELSHWSEYDYVIVNKNIETSINQAEAILMAERLKRKRQVGLGDFVRKLSHDDCVF